MPLRRRRARNASDEDLSEGEESVPNPPQYNDNSDDNEDEDSDDYSEDYSTGEDDIEDDQEYQDEQESVVVTTQVQNEPTIQLTAEPVDKPPLEAGGEDKGIEDEVDKKEKDPSVVPTLGRFFMHDDRAGAARRGVKPGVKKLWEEKDEGVWVHDKFEALDLDERPHRARGSRGRGRGRGVRNGRDHTANYVPQLEPGKNRERRNTSQYNAHNVTQFSTQNNTHQSMSNAVEFNRPAQTEILQAVSVGEAPHKPHKRYSSQREVAPQVDGRAFRKDVHHDQNAHTGSNTRIPQADFIPRAHQASYGVPYTATAVPYGYIPPPQYQYTTSYPYGSYIEPQAVPFASVPYVPYYSMPVAMDPQASYGRGRNPLVSYSNKVWVPKYSKAIPITDPNDAQPKHSKAIPITDPSSGQSISTDNSLAADASTS